eukprot:TRINITY_DN5046_c0_g1_i2.p1 TRINITY_DN5046_c0_g1~~TRINITY_DN5046_c0_g1_i2.p1  ORF type:complete len:351 (-),score=81.53 TRINITY_DN5046_c0_g1_i2:44-1096(-)
MRDALNQTNRPIYFSLCGWNTWYAPVGASLGNSWRIAGDCNTWSNVLNAIDSNAPLYHYAGPGGWNDPDMLLGTSARAASSLTKTRSRTMFNQWAVMAAPLLIGSNILHLPPYDLETYSNTEIIAVNQDRLGVQGVRIEGGNLKNIGSIVAVVEPCTENNPSQVWDAEFKNDHHSLYMSFDITNRNLIYGTVFDKDHRFKIENNKLLIHNLCVSVLPDRKHIYPYECHLVEDQESSFWFNEQGRFYTNIKGEEYCLTALPAEMVSTTNIWARKLYDGSVAVIFLNNHDEPAQIECNTECFKKMGFDGTEILNIRDLELHKNIQTLQLPGKFDPTVEPLGGSNIYLIGKVQ